MFPVKSCLFAALVLPALAASVRADFLVYKLGTKGQSRQPGGPGGSQGAPSFVNAGGGEGGNPYGGGNSSGSGREIILYGNVSVERGGILSYTHPDTNEQLLFQPNQVEHKRAPTMKMECSKMLSQAGSDPDAVFKAALWAVKKGFVANFYEGIDKLLALDPSHEGAQRVKELKKELDVPLPENPATENALRSIVNRPRMRIESSNHFVLLHDTNAKAPSGHHLPRAKERLRLLERAYERFVLLFSAQGVTLDLPHERMMAVLFKDEDDFREFASRLSSATDGSAGFWDPFGNVSYFYDGSMTDVAKDLETEHDALEKVAGDAKKKRDRETLRQININSALVEIDQLNSDVSAVFHAESRQLAANTGLFPRHVEIPRWVSEGLSTYFEAPVDATWAGSAAVDDLRLNDYKELEKDRLHSNVNFIIGDQIFDDAAPDRVQQYASAQSWALTHFLLENHARELVAFYKVLGEMPPDVTLSPRLLQQLFRRSFAAESRSLTQEWHSYMRTLKSDVERLEAASDKKSR